MHIPSLIGHKRDGGSLSAGEIHAVIQAFTRGTMPDYQMSALAMAICFQGMTSEETTALTEAMLRSGSTLQWADHAPPRVDKHSTGGIGDKTSLILAPLLACDGLWVPMISGRDSASRAALWTSWRASPVSAPSSARRRSTP